MNFPTLLIYILFIIESVFGKKHFYINDVKCLSKTEIVEIKTCEIIKSDKIDSGINTIEIEFKKRVDKINIHAETFKLTNGEYKPFLIKFDADLCAVLEKGSFGTDIWSKLITKIIKKLDTNAYHKCPFEGLLYARNMTFDLQDFPILDSLILPGSFRISINFNYGDGHSVIFDYYTEVKDI